MIDLSPNKVTPLLKALAMLLFIALPFAGFWVGVEYTSQRSVSIKSNNLINDKATYSAAEQAVIEGNYVGSPGAKVGTIHDFRNLPDEIPYDINAVPRYFLTDNVSVNIPRTIKVPQGAYIQFFLKDDKNDLVRMLPGSDVSPFDVSNFNYSQSWRPADTVDGMNQVVQPAESGLYSYVYVIAKPPVYPQDLEKGTPPPSFQFSTYENKKLLNVQGVVRDVIEVGEIGDPFEVINTVPEQVKG